MLVYPAKFTDRNGEEITIIYNDGKILRMKIRDVEFWGYDFDGLEPETSTDISKLQTFTFAQNDLCNCTIECDTAIEVITNEKATIGNLQFHIELGLPEPKGGIDHEDVFLTLSYEDQVFRSKGTSGWFEDELLDIEKQLPINHKLKCCFGCAFSDYSVYGHGLFGSGCFVSEISKTII